MKYNGNIIEFLESLNDRDTENLLDEILASPNIDKRMEFCDDLINYLMVSGLVSDETLEDIEDDIKNLAVN